MSSWKNIRKTQIIHKERHQPEERKYLGPLEKKKDYKIRALDQNEKRLKLKLLRQKALDKNPDEFHFHMINSSLKGGVHYEKVLNEKISIADVATDLAYITYKRTIEKKKIEKLKAKLHLIGTDSVHASSPSNTHILFVDTEKEAPKADPAKLLDTHPSLLKRPFNRLKLSQLEEISFDSTSSKAVNVTELNKERNQAYKELAQRIKREKKLKILEEKLTMRKKIMHVQNKGQKLPELVQEETDSSAPLYQWSRQRNK